ncbi:MAG: divalent-cation tolerance protein CutA [Pseudomonadota bacterium]|nr:divalent-cation tolerance protein CutA [Pseudomonadota bacterium]
MTEFIQIAVTIDDEAAARRLAHCLVVEGWAACVQVTGPVESVYRWEGRVETAREWRCLVKARTDLFDEIAAVIQDVHPYDTAEIVAVPICRGSDKYLAWLREVLAEKKPRP